jgi:hypothetical protein
MHHERFAARDSESAHRFDQLRLAVRQKFSHKDLPR